MTKTSIITVQGTDIALTTINDEDYISLTDIIKAKDGDFFISDWLRNRNTLEYLVLGSLCSTLILIMANSP